MNTGIAFKLKILVRHRTYKTETFLMSQTSGHCITNPVRKEACPEVWAKIHGIFKLEPKGAAYCFSLSFRPDVYNEQTLVLNHNYFCEYYLMDVV